MSEKVAVKNSASNTKPGTEVQKDGLFSWSRAIGPVEKDHGDLPLLVCCLVTGIVDGAAFGNYAVFVGVSILSMTAATFTELVL